MNHLLGTKTRKKSEAAGNNRQKLRRKEEHERGVFEERAEKTSKN